MNSSILFNRSKSSLALHLTLPGVLTTQEFLSTVNIFQYFSFVPCTLSEAKQTRWDGACRMYQKQSFIPKAACHHYTSVLSATGRLGGVCIQSLAFPSDHLVCQKMPKKLFHMLHGSLLSINNFMYLNGRDQSVKFCLCSNSPLICPHQWDAVAGKRSLQVFQPATYTGP